MATENTAPNEERVGVYICRCGGNISDHVDVEALADQVKGLPHVAETHTNMFMCSDPGQELIMEDIRSGKVNRVVVASCAPSLHELTFRGAIQRAGMNPFMYEHANIREQVSWVHHGEAATEKASRLVAAAAAKAGQLTPLEPIRVSAKRHATVVGGGVAGLRAARDIADLGIDVTLVEKSPFLGGRTAQLDRLAPTNESAEDLIRDLWNAVASRPNITVHTCAEITDAEGYVGNFKATITRRPPEDPADLEKLDRWAKAGVGADGFVPFAGIRPDKVPTRTEEMVLETGAVVLATGFKNYQPREGEYGYGRSSRVVTLPELIRRLGETPSKGDYLTFEGKPVRRMAFIHCVGSRQIPGIHEPDENGDLNEYCSRVCCTAALAAANRIREAHPKTRVLDFYRDIRTYGRGQEAVYDQASQNGVLFFRFEADAAPSVEAVGDVLKITVNDVLTFNEEIEAEVDLVVLATGMEPSDVSDLASRMKLPAGADRFLLEVHPKLRPVELANTGVLLAGTCQAPMDAGETCAAAQAASVKASALLKSGYVELDPFVASVNPEKCAGAGDCAQACGESAIEMIETEKDGQTVKQARVNPALCTGCGVCVAVCRENAINVDGWTLKQYEAMVDAIVGM